jgi:hypothetical protein
MLRGVGVAITGWNRLALLSNKTCCLQDRASELGKNQEETRDDGELLGVDIEAQCSWVLSSRIAGAFTSTYDER